MKGLYKIEHTVQNRIRVMKIVARSEEEAKLKAVQRFGELDIVRVKEIDVDKMLEETLHNQEKLMEKIHQKTDTIVQFKVSLLEYRSLEQKKRNHPDYHCYRIKWVTKEGNNPNRKYLAINPQHALDLFYREQAGMVIEKESVTVEELIVSYQIRQIETYIEKIKANMEKEMDTVSRFRQKAWELEGYQKTILSID